MGLADRRAHASDRLASIAGARRGRRIGEIRRAFEERKGSAQEVGEGVASPPPLALRAGYNTIQYFL